MSVLIMMILLVGIAGAGPMAQQTQPVYPDRPRLRVQDSDKDDADVMEAKDDAEVESDAVAEIEPGATDDEAELDEASAKEPEQPAGRQFQYDPIGRVTDVRQPNAPDADSDTERGNAE